MDFKEITKYTPKELEQIMTDNLISSPILNTIEEYNETGEHMEQLWHKNDIISCLWFAALHDSMYGFEHSHPDNFDWEAEAEDDEQNPVFFEGKKVKFNYKVKDE